MIIQSHGIELDISVDSDVFFEDSEDKENALFVNWSELDEETQSQLRELAVQAQGIMERGAGILRILRSS